MKTIQLTQGQVALVDDEDFERVNQFKWYAHKKKSSYYAVRQVRQTNRKQKMCFLHRFIMDTPDGILTDHRDHDGLNNQKYNLRNCTKYQNNCNKNKAKDKSSIYKGVSLVSKRKKYIAHIRINRKIVHLGYFPLTPEGEILAAKAYDDKASEHFGEFAQLNFSTEGLSNG